MKSIELTEKHKSKLLEMCKTLFPENETWRFDQNTYTRFLEYADEKNTVFYIHWFEFCNNWLSDKILANKIERNTKDKLLDYFWNNNLYWFKDHPKYFSTIICEEALHPIDYLYEEFKKLKL